MSSLLRSKGVWVASFASWMGLCLFELGRDLLMIGPDAPGLRAEQFLPFVESIVLWAAVSPLIVALCQRLPLDRGARIRSLSLHVLWSLAFCIGDVLVDTLFRFAVDLDARPFQRLFYAEVVTNTFSYGAVAAAGYAVIYSRELARNRVRSAELERRLAQARLEALARRLQPHFLFNSLNSIAALIRLADAQKALAALVSLSDLLRVVLTTHGDAQVTLEQELEWVQRYLDIERLRFDDRLRTEVSVEPALDRALVPALVLQPFVENAIRHGIEQRRGRGLVSIAARRDGDFLEVNVRDIGDHEAAAPERTGFGVGLDSTHERLAHLYGTGRFLLDVSTSGRETTARIRVPYAVAAS